MTDAEKIEVLRLVAETIAGATTAPEIEDRLWAAIASLAMGTDR